MMWQHLRAARTWTYVPVGDFNGSVALSYEVSDGEFTAPVNTSITVTPVDDPAMIDGDSTGVVTEGDGHLLPMVS